MIPLAVAFGLALAGMTTAQESGSPYFLVTTEDGVEAFPLRSTSVHANVGGVIADVTVTQVYANEGSVPIEAVYVFPASTRAAVHGMTVTIGDRVLEAEIREREQARAEYEEARDAGQNAALLEQERPNVFMMSVANIMPGDVVEVELRYTELLVPDGGEYEFLYPTVVGPRYGQAEFNENPYLGEGEAAPYGFDITIDLVTGVELAGLDTPGHDTTVAATTSGAWRIALAPGETGGNRDFIMRYRLGGDSVSSGLLLQPDEDGQGGWFLVMAQPPARNLTIDLPTEYMFVIDVSGSMHGFPLETARSLLDSILANMTPGDRFNILLFSGDSRVMAAESVPFTAANVARAREFVGSASGSGSTELLGALNRALTLPRADDMATSIVVVTDGYVTVEREALHLVRDNLGEANLFAFGIGSSVNHHLIESLARAGRGEPFIVTAPADAPAAAERLRSYVAAPVLTNVSVRFDGLRVVEMEPAAQPDLLAERPVLVFGRYEGPATGTVTVSGRGGDGDWGEVFHVAERGVNVQGRPLSYLWAREVITRLSDDLASESWNWWGSQDPEVASEEQKRITQLGLDFSLLTEFTSFVAIDSLVRGDGTFEQVRQPVPLPQGVSNLAVGDGMVMRTAAPLMGQAIPAPPSASFETDSDWAAGEAGAVEQLVVTGSLSSLDAAAVVEEQADDLGSCLPGGGRVQVSLSIGADGSVSSVVLTALTAATAESELECLRGVLEGLRFPAGGELTFVLQAR